MISHAIVFGLYGLSFALLGAWLTYRRQTYQSPMDSARNMFKAIMGREPTPDQSSTIDGEEIPDSQRYSPEESTRPSSRADIS